MVGRLRKLLGDAVDEVGDVTADLLLGVEHQTDDVRLAGPQPHARPVGPVADLPGHQLHAAAGLFADLRRVLQRARDRGDAETGHEGDRLQGRPAGRRGLRLHGPRELRLVHLSGWQPAHGLLGLLARSVGTNRSRVQR